MSSIVGGCYWPLGAIIGIWRFGPLLFVGWLMLAPAPSFAHQQTTPRRQSEAEVATVEVLNAELRGSSTSRSAQPSDPKRLQTAAKERAAAMARLVTTDPKSVVALALTSQERKALPKGARKYVEQQRDLEGELQIFHIDHEDEHSEYRAHIARAGTLIPIQIGASLNGANPGDQVRIRALDVPGASASVAAQITVQSPTSATALGPQWTAVILVSGPSAGAHPYSAVQSANLVFASANPGGARNFFLQASYNQTTITGAGPTGAEGTTADVYGPYTLSHTGCDFSTIRGQAIAAADVNINYSNYHRVIIVWNNAGCGGGGVANVRTVGLSTGEGTQRLGVAMVFNTGFGPTSGSTSTVGRVTLHEYGHSLGVWHGNALECGGVAIGSGACASTEYGDRADVMGTGSYGHLNAVHKDILGWLTGSRLQTVTSGGTYTLNSYEDGLNNVKALRMPRTRNGSNAVTGYYYLEFRQPSAPFNDYLSSGNTSRYEEGVLLHATGSFPLCASTCNPDFSGAGGGGDSHLIDTKPNSTSNDFSDAPIFPGDSYVDAAAGVTVNVDSVGGGLANLSIAIAGPGSTRAIQSIVYPAAGGSVTGGGTFAIGQAVIVTAVANPGYVFTGWRENRSSIGGVNPLSFTLASDRFLEALFTIAPCSPRPPVVVSSAQVAGGLVANVSSSAGLQSIRFLATDNTQVTMGTQTNMTGTFTVNFSAGTTATSFTYQRQLTDRAGTVRFEVTDGCGVWPSFVGGGTAAW
ncbi:MAG: InlB B-repeat-containing protein [Chloroflexota bacterium]